jgi:hypothetical protein
LLKELFEGQCLDFSTLESPEPKRDNLVEPILSGRSPALTNPRFIAFKRSLCAQETSTNTFDLQATLRDPPLY